MIKFLYKLQFDSIIKLHKNTGNLDVDIHTMPFPRYDEPPFLFSIDHRISDGCHSHFKSNVSGLIYRKVKYS